MPAAAINEQITVQVAYALPDEQHVITLSVTAGCTVQHAIEISGLLQQFPDMPLSGIIPGIFGKPVSHSAILQNGDRVEIYRPLLLDPKESRRQRALHAKNKK